MTKNGEIKESYFKNKLSNIKIMSCDTGSRDVILTSLYKRIKTVHEIITFRTILTVNISENLKDFSLIH